MRPLLRAPALLVALAAGAGLALTGRALAAPDAGAPVARDGGADDAALQQNLELLQDYELLQDLDLVTPAPDAGPDPAP